MSDYNQRVRIVVRRLAEPTVSFLNGFADSKGWKRTTGLDDEHSIKREVNPAKGAFRKYGIRKPVVKSKFRRFSVKSEIPEDELTFLEEVSRELFSEWQAYQGVLQ